MRPLLVLAALVLLLGPPAARGEEDAAAAALRARVRTMLREGDAFQVFELVQAEGDVLEVAARYVTLALGLHREDRDLRASLLVGRAGVHWCLTKANETADPETRRALRVTAQRLSFDLASNAWPGWGDEGIVIGPAELASGLDLARLDLRLVQEMDYPPTKHANAHWIVGVQLLAAGRLDEARTELEASVAHATAAEAEDKAWMARGYLAIVDLHARPGDPAGVAALQEAVSRLRALGTEDASFYATQLLDVRRTLEQRAAAGRDAPR